MLKAFHLHPITVVIPAHAGIHSTSSPSGFQNEFGMTVRGPFIHSETLLEFLRRQKTIKTRFVIVIPAKAGIHTKSSSGGFQNKFGMTL